MAASKKKRQIEIIASGDLRVDPRVQRAEDKSQVDYLGREWDDQYVGVLAGSRRADGHVYLMDGQQRWTAMTTRKNNFKYPFTVQVYSGLTLKEEAEIFQGYNRGRKAVTPYANHIVSIMAENPTALAVENVVTALGFQTGAKSHGTTVGCISLMYRVLEDKTSNIDDQKDFLSMALDTSYKTFGDTEWPFRGDIVEGLAIFWSKHWNDPNVDQDVLVKKIKAKYTVPQLLQLSRNRAVGNNRPVGEMCRIFEEIYNWKRPNGSKLAAA
jgi:hypothetical protein